MLKGSNRLVLNESAMIEIVQYYLENKLLNKDERSPTVTNFRVSEGHGRDNISYDVFLSTADEEAS
jgi:hypothetical protein